MTSRRTFLSKSVAVAGGLSIATLPIDRVRAGEIAETFSSLQSLPPTEAVSQEEPWQIIADSFTVSREYVDLNNAGISPQPKIVQEALEKFNRLSNEGPSHYNWNVANKGRVDSKKTLAAMAGAFETEIAIVRNTTEALATVTWGLPMKPGDEIVMTNLDYPNMIHAWKQKEKRDGIQIRWIDLDVPIEDEEIFVKLFVEATNSRTRAWHITHMINWNGQILPVKRLCEEARKRGVLSIVDGAQSFGQLSFSLHDLDPDFFGASLHKWVCAPHGLGMLYVKKQNIAGLWPLFPDDDPTRDDIRKFESLGTRSLTAEMALARAIGFHLVIGTQVKEERLRYLTNYWCDKIKAHPRVKLHTSLDSRFSCAIANFAIEGIEDSVVTSRLFNEYKIIATQANFGKARGVRISPNVYTLTKDLDRLVEAVLKICDS